jgi:hypothetical protein
MVRKRRSTSRELRELYETFLLLALLLLLLALHSRFRFSTPPSRLQAQPAVSDLDAEESIVAI